MLEQQGLLGDHLRATRRLARPPLSDERDGRRLAGLRRAEVARSPGTTEAYYEPSEQGRDRHPSESVLRNLANAPHLDGFALQHMRRLVGLDESVSPTRSNVRERGRWGSANRIGERRGKLRSKRGLR
ncbi:hypothetical protein DEI98_04210 [Curtobacterium sp. MCLR17_034]|nr:hypothetical protein DEI98_04210 [Curtobacterium sp. MCLR17_034]